MPSTRSTHKHLSSPALSASSKRADSPLATSPYLSDRPGLADILADNAPEPWSLASFRYYCQQNMCLENLDFTIDVKQYKSNYRRLIGSGNSSGLARLETASIIQLKSQWQDILSCYILPNGSREINLPAGIRDKLMLAPESTMPPPPELLQPAVGQIYALMEDSILLSFLNDLRMESASEDDFDMGFDDDERARKTKSMFVESSAIPASLMFPPVAYANSHYLAEAVTPQTSTASSHLSRPKSTLTAKHSHSSSNNSTNGEPGLTDDNVSFSTRTSATNDGLSPPRTPPTSSPATAVFPPLSSTVMGTHGNGTVKTSHPLVTTDPWKKMGSKLGFRRKA